MAGAKETWQEALSDLITDPKELFDVLALDPALIEQANAAAREFALKVPRNFVERIEKGNLNDPLLKQILPVKEELAVVEGYQKDPLAESKVNPVPGLLHKYEGRVLVTLTGACAIHCRYCFRRHFPYDANIASRQRWDKIFAYIKQDRSIVEVILSGGDPLAVSDRLLQQFTEQLTLIEHVRRLRIHTRMPIVMPERLTDEWIDWCVQLPLDIVMVIHANHPNEINAEVRAALLRLRAAGLLVLNQSVLLKGVNDCADTLVLLSETLFAAGVLPYYLHVLDKVEGAAHFDLNLSIAQAIHTKLNQKLPGYLVPKLVYEEPGASSKSLLSTALCTG